MISLDFISQFRVYCKEQPYIFCLKWILPLQKPIIYHIVHQNRTRNSWKKCCLTKSGNLDQCAMEIFNQYKIWILNSKEIFDLFKEFQFLKNMTILILYYKQYFGSRGIQIWSRFFKDLCNFRWIEVRSSFFSRIHSYFQRIYIQIQDLPKKGQIYN